MKRLLALALALGACDTAEPPPPAPVSGAGTPTKLYDCGDYRTCAVRCSGLEWGRHTRDARVDCVERCALPETDTAPDLLADWAYECAGVGRLSAGCDEGLAICEAGQ